jgi:hypothetical protein
MRRLIPESQFFGVKLLKQYLNKKMLVDSEFKKESFRYLAVHISETIKTLRRNLESIKREGREFST